LWVRALDAATAQPLPGTEGGWFPFWSPDSRWAGFFADMQLKRLHYRAADGRTEFTPDHLGLLADFLRIARDPNFNQERWIDYVVGECDRCVQRKSLQSSLARHSRLFGDFINALNRKFTVSSQDWRFRKSRLMMQFPGFRCRKFCKSWTGCERSMRIREATWRSRGNAK
jgi:hypothetical protein